MSGQAPPIRFNGTAWGLLALLVLAGTFGVGCGTSSDKLSSSQVTALTARVKTFNTGLGGSNRGIRTCARQGGDTQQRTTCVARVMDDAAGHVRDLAAYIDGVAASAGGTCKTSLDALSAKLSSQAAIFTKSGQLARAEDIPAFKKTISGINGAAVARLAKGVETACG